MPEDRVAQRLVSGLEAMLRRAGAELGRVLRSPVQPAATFGGRLAAPAWAETLTSPSLLVSGSLTGAAEGPVVFALTMEDAIRLACCAAGVGAEELSERLKRPVSDADTAAVVFALARLGAAGTEAWREEFAAAVRWPSEATELHAAPAEAGKAGEALPAEVAAAPALVLTRVRLSGALAIGIDVLLPASLAEALAGLLGSGPRPRPAQVGGGDLARLLPVQVPVRVIVARRATRLQELLELAPGRVLDLAMPSRAPLELVAGGKVVARGLAVQADRKLAFHVSELVQGDTLASRVREPLP